MHYTYEILEIPTQIAYIGVRTCEGLALDDLGHTYFSSSLDKEFKKRQKKNPENYRYLILKTFDTREEAAKHEIYLHAINDVGRNPKFYNRSKQAASGGFSNQSGKHNFAAKAVQVNQWQFATIKDAAKQTGISTATVRNYIKSEDYPNCKFIDKVTIMNPPMDKAFWKRQKSLNQSKSLKGKIHPSTTGVKHPQARAIQLELYQFGFMGEAVDKTGLGASTIRYMIKSEDYPNCKFIDKVTIMNPPMDKAFWKRQSHLIKSRARKGIVNSPEAIERSRQSLIKHFELHGNPRKGQKLPQMVGGLNPAAKAISIDGKQYECMKDALVELSFSKNTLRRRLKSTKYPNYQYT